MKLFNENLERVYLYRYVDGDYTSYTETYYLSTKEITEEDLELAGLEYDSLVSNCQKEHREVWDSKPDWSNLARLSPDERAEIEGKWLTERKLLPNCPNRQEFIANYFKLEEYETDMDL